MQTPEFLIWALEFSCPIRGFQDGSDPERTERQLRAARAYGDACLEGRVLEGLALDPPNGFRVDEALAIYGGAATLARRCGGCPANALQDLQAEALAGCYGLLPLPEDAAALHRAIDAACPAAIARPAWYGLWIESPIEGPRLSALQPIIAAAWPRSELLAAIETAIRSGCRLHARLYPRGQVIGTDWKLAPHCPRCKGAWTVCKSRNATEGVPYSTVQRVPYSAEGVCSVCGHVGHPAPDKKRKARGVRPYYPLQRLVGEKHAAELLARFAAQAPPAPPDQPQSPLALAPPDSRPAD